MTTATRTEPTGKKSISISLENFAIIQMYSMYPSVLELAPAEYAKKAFNSKYENQKLSVVVQVVCNTQNLVISRCCPPKNGYERQCTASHRKNFCLSTDVYFVLAKHEPHVLVSTGDVLFFQLPAILDPRAGFFVRAGHA